ncbi:hypothetical protein IJ384_01305, partial [bacterium]|nr:hypothetical protein [bacterium]
MSKFWAKVEFKQEKNAEHLIRAFFQNFDPDSSIVVRGTEAKMEIIFQQPPMAIIDAISHCQVIELNYGKDLKEYEEEKDSNIETENNFEQVIVEGESSEQQREQEKIENEKIERPEKEDTESENGEDSIKEVKTELPPINIPELEEIAKNAASFKNFVKSVTEWLEMDKRQELFEELVIVSIEVDKLSWKELEKALEDKGVTYKKWDKVWISNQVSEKLKEYSITMMPLLNAIRQYKEYAFEQKENSIVQAEETIHNDKEKSEKANEIDIPKHRLKMECMPEIKDFEETLA